MFKVILPSILWSIVFCSSEVLKLAIQGNGFSRNIEEIGYKSDFSGTIKKKSRRICSDLGFWSPNSQEVPISKGFLGSSFVLSKISKGKVTNREIPVVFFKKYILKPSFFSGIVQLTNNKSISDKTFVSVQSWTIFFYTNFSLCHGLSIQIFSQFPGQKCMVLSAIYLVTATAA